MDIPDKTLYDLQSLINTFSLVERCHSIPGTKVQENDAVHSYAVAMLSWYIIDRYSLNLNIEKVLKYVLVHDIAEIYAGDVNTYASTTERKAKINREQKALNKLKGELTDFPQLIYAAEQYEAKLDEESLFVWTVDKIQALVLGDLDVWRPYKKIGVSYSAFIRKNAELLADASPFCKEIFEAIINYSKTTFYDQP